VTAVRADGEEEAPAAPAGLEANIAAHEPGPLSGSLLAEFDPAAQLGKDLAGRLSTAVDRRAGRHVGLSVAVLVGNRTAFFGRGHVHRDRPDKPAPDTLFEIGSITKTFTATTLALMALDGTVALDDPIQKYLPAGVELPVRGRPITLADLATHSSGLPASHPGMLRQWWHHRSDPYAGITRDDLYAAVNRTKPRAAPGKKWRYSNFGAALLGNALASRAGASYEELVTRSICAPLALGDTVVTVDERRAGRFAQGHDRRGRPVPHWELPAFAGAGALRSTAADMIAYLRAQLESAAGVADEERRRDVAPAAVAGARQAAAEPDAAAADLAGTTAAEEAGIAAPDAGVAPAVTIERLHAALRLTQAPHVRRRRLVMGLGWILLPQQSRPWPLFFHNGGTGGFRSFAGFVPQTGTAVVVLVNDSRSPDRLGRELTDLLQDAAAS
jgi:CubicO group peptidase (beta-lactamase class C family)